MTKSIKCKVYLAYLELKNEKMGGRQSIPIEYEGIKFDEGFKADIIVENKVILELKSVESVTKAHKKQILTYLKLTGYKLGYLLNFGESLMKKGISRIINGKID